MYPLRNIVICLFFFGALFTHLELTAQKVGAADAETSEALFRAGRFDEAKKRLQTRLKEDPKSVPDGLLLTQILLLEDSFDAAHDQVHQILRLSPENAKAITLYGHCLFRQGKFEKAEAEYRRSLRLNPDQAGAYRGLGRLYLTKLQTKESTQAFQKAISLDPGDEDNYFFASEAYGAQKNHAKQVECLEKYLELKPKFNEERVKNAEALLLFFRALNKTAPAKVTNSARSYEIPVQPFYGLMLAETKVNGQGPYRFLVDSGATSTVLSEALIEELKVPVLSNAVASCVGGSGRTGTKLARIDTFQVGDLEITNLPVSSFDNAIFSGLIDGVLSTADLADFLITLDYVDRKILLDPQKGAPAEKANTQHAASVVAPFRILGNLILLPVVVNGRESQSFLFDTGAVTSTLSKRQAAFLGVTEDTPKAKVDLQFAGACGVTQSVLSVPRVNLSLVGMTTPFAKILAVELKEISKELRTEVSGILGGDFYSKRKVMIDYVNTKIVID